MSENIEEGRRVLRVEAQSILDTAERLKGASIAPCS